MNGSVKKKPGSDQIRNFCNKKYRSKRRREKRKRRQKISRVIFWHRSSSIIDLPSSETPPPPSTLTSEYAPDYLDTLHLFLSLNLVYGFYIRWLLIQRCAPMNFSMKKLAILLPRFYQHERMQNVTKRQPTILNVSLF